MHVPLFAKQYKLVPAKGRRQPAAGRVTVGMAGPLSPRVRLCMSRSGLFDRFAARYLYGMLRLTRLGLMPIYKQYGMY